MLTAEQAAAGAGFFVLEKDRLFSKVVFGSPPAMSPAEQVGPFF